LAEEEEREYKIMLAQSKKYNYKLNEDIKAITDDFHYQPIHTIDEIPSPMKK